MNKILRAIDFIESHLPIGTSIEEIANHCFTSKWHLQKCFKNTVGLSIGQYQRYRLLSLAAQRIASTQERILDIAIEYGFESQEAFARSFKRFANVSPRNLRNNPQWAALITLQKLDKKALSNIECYRRIQSELITEESQRWASYCYQVPNSADDNISVISQVMSFWETFYRRDELPAMKDRTPVLMEFRQLNHFTSGSFPMAIAYPIHKNEPVPSDMIEVVLPKRQMYRFVLPSTDHALPFLNYLYTNWCQNQKVAIGIPPLIWKGGVGEFLTCLVPAKPESTSELPIGMVTSPQIVVSPEASVQVKEVSLPELDNFGSRRISSFLRRFKSLTDLELNCECVYFSDNVQYVNKVEIQPFKIYIREEAASTSTMISGDFTSACIRKLNVPSGQYLQSQWRGTILDVEHGLEVFFHDYLQSSPFYYTPQTQFITGLCVENGFYSFTLNTPVKRRRG